ncbi:MAG: ATP-binding protein [Candidatus Nitrosopolaris sp.]
MKFLSKNGNAIIILSMIAGVTIFLSAVSYQYSVSTSNQILDIAAAEIRSNAIIEAHDLSQSLQNKLETVTTNLQTISSAHSVQTGSELMAQPILDAAQMSTASLTDGYYWLDSNGNMVAHSYSNDGNYSGHIGTHRYSRFRNYFSSALGKNIPYYSSVINSTNNIQKIYISYPIIGSLANTHSNVAKASAKKVSVVGSSNIGDNNDTPPTTQRLKGVVITSVTATIIGRTLHHELSPRFRNTVGLMDKKGTMLYSQKESLIGKNYFGNQFQSVIPYSIKDELNNIIKRSLEGNGGLEDITAKGNTTSIAYEPVILNGGYLWTLYVFAPHRLASNVYGVVNERANFSTIVLIIIGALALGIAFIILSWNKRLKISVDARTSELKKAIDSLNQANKQLRDHDKMQEEFINVAAHELRAPTQSIMGYSELLKMLQSERNYDDYGITKEGAIDAISRNAIRLRHLTNEILDASQIEGHRLKLNKEKFNLNELIQNAVKDIKSQVAAANGSSDNIEFSVQSKEPIFVYADSRRIYQVVSNLLSNAVKFTTTKKGVRETITISIDTGYREELKIGFEKETTGEVTVSVKDRGRGIDQEIRPRLFSKFATTSDGGTGLGLFISKWIIEAHDGKIWTENNSEGQKGAIFIFTLPISEYNTR